MDKFNLYIEIVKMTIKSLKSGVGGLPAEILKSGTEILYELLRQIFERCLNGDEIPNDLKLGHILFIHKKGKDEYENYIGITVLNIFSRLYGKILKHILEQEFSHIETEEQA